MRARTYNQSHLARAHSGGRRISIYWTWSYPWEAQRDPASMENRFSTITEVRNVLGSFMFSGDDALKPARVLSGGEKTRLALAALVVSQANVLLLDEPTNNLDPASRAEILRALRSFEGAVVLVTHDEGAVDALEPERVLLLPDAVEDFWSAAYRDLIALA